MFSIEPHYNQYRIKLSGDRRKYFARDLQEVHNALDHYHAKSHDHAACPFCRHMAEHKHKDL